MIHRNCEISIKKSHKMSEKYRDSENCTASADEPVERQTKES